MATDRERFPGLFKENQIDRRGAKRTVPMRILAFGMMRTGTSSLQAALEKLGYGPCYHMNQTIANPPDCHLWIEALDAKYYNRGPPFTIREWDMLLGHCSAIIDFPGVCFAPELIAAYPDAKVILTLRDYDAWYRSCCETIVRLAEDWSLWMLYHVDREFWHIWMSLAYKMFDALFGGSVKFRASGKARFIEFQDDVRQLVPKERLLEYRVGEGWERLCDFLEVEVPNEEFPRINDGKDFKETFGALIRIRASSVTKKALPFAGALVALGGALWWMR